MDPTELVVYNMYNVYTHKVSKKYCNQQRRHIILYSNTRFSNLSSIILTVLTV